MKRAIVVLLLVGSAGTAAADREAFKERLTKEEILAAAKAAQDRLPPVDKAAAAKCKALPQDTAIDREAMADCYRAAGSLGAAIMIWQVVAQDKSKGSPAKDAIKQLGPALEAAGRYHDAAGYHSQYAKVYGAEKDAADHMIRAICIWRQLDDATSADRAFEYLRRLKKKSPPDSDTLCDSVRPIVPPPPEP